MWENRYLIFASEGDRTLGEKLVEKLGTRLSEYERRIFEDGEIKMRPLCDVRNSDVYLLDSCRSDHKHSVNDRLCQLFFFLGSIKDAGAKRVTLLAPYLCYSRKDRKTKLFDPTTSRYVAQLLEAMGLDEIVTIDVHNLAAYQNAFRISSRHLEASGLLALAVKDTLGSSPITVCSPDLGGIKRAQSMAQVLGHEMGFEVRFAVINKERSQDRVVTKQLIGTVEGHDVIIVDDMIVSGTTMLGAANICLAQGARRIFLVATHSLMTEEAKTIFLDSSIAGVIVSNTVPFVLPQELGLKFQTVDVSSLLAQVVLSGGKPAVISGTQNFLDT